MNIEIDLEYLKLKNVLFEDEVLRYKGYRLELWNTNLGKIIEDFTIARDMFFQSEYTINEDVLMSKSLDIETATLELANLLFDNLQMAEALRQFTLVPFNEIKEENVTYDDPVTYEVNGELFELYNYDMLMATAKEFHRSNLEDNLYSDDSKDLLMVYKEFIDINGLSKELEIEKSLPLDEKYNILLNLAADNSESIFDKIIDYIDFDKVTDDDIREDQDAIDVLTNIIGDFEITKRISILNWKPEFIYIFSKF